MAQRPGDRAPNALLAQFLDELGWSPKSLARRLNQTFGTGTVAESAPYHWRDSGSVPRSPLPVMTAHVLSQELGRTISAEELWQGPVAGATSLVPADKDLTHPWTLQGLTRAVEDWVLAGLVDRRRFLATSGAGLLSTVAQYLDGTAGRGTITPRMHTAGEDPLIDQIEHSLPLLQRLDDEHGGARHLPYVGAQFRAVGMLIREGGHPTTVQSRLITALAEIGQLAGWMAFDASDHGIAQRYFITALRAAHQVNDSPLCAHILADMAFQAGSRQQPADAVRLGEAASRAAAEAPIAVRASVLSRLAYAYAIAGRPTNFARTRATARELIGQQRSGDDPRWMYFLTDNHLDCQAGYALVQLGRAHRRDGKTVAGTKQVAQGTALLDTGAHTVPHGDPSQRRALFEGAWLALGHSARGELELACTVGSTAIERLAYVRSPRSTSLLQQLAADLRRRQRNAHVRDFLPELEHALKTHLATTSTRH